MHVSEIKSRQAARDFRLRQASEFRDLTPQDLRSLEDYGISVTPEFSRQLASFAMDSQQPTVTTPSIAAPVQFLQKWLPGIVAIDTSPRQIDSLAGKTIAGTWSDEQIVQAILEMTGEATPYDDYSNVNYANWNLNFAVRTIVRFQIGLEMGLREQAVAAASNVNASDWKRKACAKMLEVSRNLIGFYGFNNGANQTYGFLNDPSLPPYVTVANGASGSPLFSTKTLLEIITDIQSWITGIISTSGSLIQPVGGVDGANSVRLTLALPSDVLVYLTTVSTFGYSVINWLNTNYPGIHVNFAPELNNANGGANVAYLYADEVDDGSDNEQSTDDHRTMDQYVPMQFMPTGVQPTVKGFKEAYLNATAGVMVKRPLAVYRASGI